MTQPVSGEQPAPGAVPFTPAPPLGNGAAAPAAPRPVDRPELVVGAAFAGGALFALLLKRVGRVS